MGAMSLRQQPPTSVMAERSKTSAPNLTHLLLMPSAIPLPREEDDKVIAEVLWVDHFEIANSTLDPMTCRSLGVRLFH